jgi:hypothetical protein
MGGNKIKGGYIMKIKQAILQDNETLEIYTILIFEKMEEMEEIQNTINNVKNKYLTDWQVGDIEEAICDKFNVKEILYIGNQEETFYI